MIFICVESKNQNNWTKKTKQKQIHIYREKMMVFRGEGVRNGRNRSKGLKSTNFQM